ncbi:MAG: carbon monoxide dehydrogenase subunit G [Chloroflexi bacterium]|nr:carbon monoxide dehydrogenase subunit G [Chloroflexota bacterium]
MVELAGIYEFTAPQELVWEMLLDADVLARIMPGCEKLERVDENMFQGKLKIRIGPVQGVFQGKVEMSDMQPPRGYHIIVNGRGSSGVVRGKGFMTLEPTETGTKLNYEGTAQVSGRIATVSQRLMDSSAKAIVKQSLQNLEKQIQARLQPEPDVADKTVGAPEAPTAVPLPDAPSQTEFMLGVAKDMVADFIPDPKQRQLLTGAALALGVIALINGFANLVARRVARILKEK